MTLRRIHTKQCRAALGDLEQKQPTPDVAILEGLCAKGLLQRVELNQLQGQCAAQKLIAIKLDRMPVQGRIHLIDRAAMISGDLCHTLVDELVVVHDASLPRLAASRRGLAFERAHFSPDPLNGGSPDADGRSRLVNPRATPQKSLDRPFRLGVDPRPPNRFAALGALAAALRMPAITRPESRLASCLAMVASTASRIPRTISLSAQRCGSV